MAVRLSALRTSRTLLPRNIISLMFPVLISVRGWVNPRAWCGILPLTTLNNYAFRYSWRILSRSFLHFEIHSLVGWIRYCCLTSLLATWSVHVSLESSLGCSSVASNCYVLEASACVSREYARILIVAGLKILNLVSSLTYLFRHIVSLRHPNILADLWARCCSSYHGAPLLVVSVSKYSHFIESKCVKSLRPTLILKNEWGWICSEL
jgi:hypothetical protein